MSKKPISIIMGSKSDLPTVQETTKILDEFKVGYDLKIFSAHRTPNELASYIKQFSKNSVKVVIAAAGGAAALSGVIASHTNLPVIGIPIETKALKGLDSLLSTVQMPPGIPVATVAIGKQGAKNSALLAIRILALGNLKIKKALDRYKQKMRKNVVALNKKTSWKDL